MFQAFSVPAQKLSSVPALDKNFLRPYRKSVVLAREIGMTTEKAAKRTGRPTKAPSPGDRVSLGLRVTADIKKMLDDEALQNGRSQSQEAEIRLEQSFQGQRMIEDIQALLDLAKSHEAAAKARSLEQGKVAVFTETELDARIRTVAAHAIAAALEHRKRVSHPGSGFLPTEDVTDG